MIRITDVLEDLGKLKILSNDYRIIKIQLLLHKLINTFNEEKLNKIIQELQIYFNDKFRASNSYFYYWSQVAYQFIKFVCFIKKTKEEIELEFDKQIILQCINNLHQILAKSVVIRENKFSSLVKYALVGSKLIWLQTEALYPEVLFLPCQQAYLPYIGQGLCTSFAASVIREVLSHNTLFGRSLTNLLALNCGTLKENNREFFNGEAQWLQQYMDYCVPMVRNVQRLTATSMDKIINTFIEHSSLNTAIWIRLLDLTDSSSVHAHSLGLIKDLQNNLILVDANSGCYIFRDDDVFRRWFAWYMEYTFYAKKFHYVGYTAVLLDHCQEIISLCTLNIKWLQCKLTIQENILEQQECNQKLLIYGKNEQYGSERIKIHDRLTQLHDNNRKNYQELQELHEQIIGFHDRRTLHSYKNQGDHPRNFLIRSVFALINNCVYFICGVQYITRNYFAAKKMSVIAYTTDYFPLTYRDVKIANSTIVSQHFLHKQPIIEKCTTTFTFGFSSFRGLTSAFMEHCLQQTHTEDIGISKKHSIAQSKYKS